MAMAISPVLALQSSGADPSDEWRMFRGNPKQTGVAKGALPEKPKVLWKYEVKEPVLSTAAIVDGRVYVGADDGSLYALDLDNGLLIWKYAAGQGVRSSPTVLNGRIYFGDSEGMVHAVDAKSGEKVWTFKAQGEIVSSVNYEGDRLVVGSYDAFVYCLAAESGSLLWQFETQGRIHGTPAIADGNVLAAGCDENLYVLNIADGSKVRSVRMGSVSGASAAASGDRAFVGTYGHQVLGIDWKKGEVVWKWEDPDREFPYLSSAAVSADSIVIGGRDKRVHCFDAAEGKKKWTFATRGRVDSSPVIAGDRVFVGSNDGNLYGLKLSTGEEVYRFETGAPISASPAIAMGVLVIGNEDGVIYCLGESGRERRNPPAEVGTSNQKP